MTHSTTCACYFKVHNVVKTTNAINMLFTSLFPNRGNPSNN
ncbi:unnamed protein product [Musa hybrid cultivar]